MKCFVVVMFLWILLHPSAGRADDCAPQTTGRLPVSVSSIKIEEGVGINSAAMTAAINKWNECSGTIPELGTASGDLSIKFNFHNQQASSGGCAITNFEWEYNEDRGVHELAGGSIETYASASNGVSCTDTIARLSRTYAHEIGHIFGLGNGSCPNRIMGPPGSSPSLAHLTPADCMAADNVTEQPPGSPGGDEANQENQCVDECGPNNTTPVLISVIDEAYWLTSPANGVFFDLDADGAPELTSWTHGDSDEAFLVLDRNANGVVDDGSELFGDVTPQPESPEPNGFVALAVFDSLEYGGNFDGFIDRDDVVFPLLQLWVDSNHNGFSEDGELDSLTGFGVQSIDLGYGESRKVDEFGNQFRFWTVVERKQGQVIAWDVIFLHF
ncbi:MAG: hypothetical protein AAF560_05705 [Acidobacteriota bacterium]